MTAIYLSWNRNCDRRRHFERGVTAKQGQIRDMHPKSYPDLASFQAALSDPNFDPTHDFVGWVRATCYIHWNGKASNQTHIEREVRQVRKATSLSFPRWGMRDASLLELEARTDALVRDPRVRIERLTVEVRRILFWALEAHLTPTIDAMLALTGQARDELGRDLDQQGLHSLVLSFILLKRPSAEELLDWMIDLDNSELSECARSVVSGADVQESLVPISTLLSHTLYPAQDTRELLSQVRASGVSATTVIHTAQLLGAFISDDG